MPTEVVQQDNLHRTPLLGLKLIEVKDYCRSINVHQVHTFANLKQQHVPCLRKIADALDWHLT